MTSGSVFIYTASVKMAQWKPFHEWNRFKVTNLSESNSAIKWHNQVFLWKRYTNYIIIIILLLLIIIIHSSSFRSLDQPVTWWIWNTFLFNKITVLLLSWHWTTLASVWYWKMVNTIKKTRRGKVSCAFILDIFPCELVEVNSAIVPRRINK